MNDNSLIFLISQPRSGSTLLQRILGTHKDIFTTSEPWLMLGFSYGLKSSGVYAEYDKVAEYIALSKFIRGLPNGGRSRYLASLRDFSLSLYGAYAEAAGRRYFLDKTPRYYLVLDELMEIFPSAKFVLLRRHPISILYSIIKTWTRESWYRLSSHKCDLINGLQTAERYVDHERIYSVTYENIVQNPREEVRSLCKYLGVSYCESMLDYGTDGHWPYGDQSKQLKSGKVNVSRLHLWKEDNMHYQLWRVLSDYLEWIGPQRMSRLGYCFHQAHAALASNCPADCIETLHDKTFGLFSLLDNTKDSLYTVELLNARISSLVSALEETKQKGSTELKGQQGRTNLINYHLLGERIKQSIRRIVEW